MRGTWRSLVTTLGLGGMVWVALAPAPAIAQPSPSAHQQHHPAPASPGTSTTMGSPGPSGGMDMMGACMQRHQAMMQRIDQLNATLDQAKRSGDPARMRSAIDQTQRTLAEMKATMQACHQMMQPMPGMSPGAMMSPAPSPGRPMP